MDHTSPGETQERTQAQRPRVVHARPVTQPLSGREAAAVHAANPGRRPVASASRRSQMSRIIMSQGNNGDDARLFNNGQGGGWNDDFDDPPKKKRKKNKHPFLCATVIVVCTLVIVSLGLLVSPQLLGTFWTGMPNYAFANGRIITWDNGRQSQYRQYRTYLERDTIFPGVYIDGIHVGDMTIDEARAALATSAQQTASPFSVTVNIGNKSWLIDNQRVPITRNVDQVLAKAYALGRQNTTALSGTDVTPFSQRLEKALSLRTEGANFTSEMTYDTATVRSLVDAIVSYVNRDAVDAQVQSFDFSTKSFTFSDESVGVQVNGDALYQQVIAKLDAREYGTAITIEPEIITPKVTKVELMNNFKLVSSYTTETTSNSNRNTNVNLSAQAINGRTVMPGETFSFNATTGQRTEAKGYKEAIAISGGQSVPDIGGGVCQTSSTLFNAVARADLEIVDRSPHAWPSSYVAKGLDATVNWPNLDFKFKNNRSTPIFIIAYYNNRKVTVEIYGMGLGTGVMIDLQSEVVRTLKAPSDVKYVQNTSLPVGSSKETIQARTGYVVDTYKVWYRDGNEIKREKLCTSTYRAFQRTVEYN